jgi:cytochrome c oxidase subunit 4
MATESHPQPKDYWFIAFVLGVITAAEVAVTYWSALDGFVAPMLLIMSALKFGIVVAYFMHLKYEAKIYRNLFVMGIIAAPLLFGAVLFTFGVLIGS